MGHPRLSSTEVTRFVISQRDFFEVFQCADEGVLAAFDDGVERVSRLVADAATRERAWVERIRAGLSALLDFLDSEPSWARFLILEPPVTSAAVLEHRQQALVAVTQTLARETAQRGPSSSAPATPPMLVAELVVGGVLSAIRARMLDRASGPLVDLLETLVSFIVAQYRSLDAGIAAEAPMAGREDAASRHQRLPVRATYRTTRVLSAIGASPRLSNREIADAAGLSDEGQTSKMLRRLEQRGLVQNVGLGQPFGEANAWLLTAHGERVLQSTRHSLVPGAGAVGARRVRGAA